VGFYHPLQVEWGFHYPRDKRRLEVFMEENETTQVEQGTEEVASQPVAEVKTQPTVEELQKEIDRKEEVIKQTKKELSEARRRGVPKEEIDTLNRKIDDMQEWTAAIMDDLAVRISGEEAVPQVKKSYRQQLEEKRKATPQPQLDPDAAKILDYLADEGIDPEDDFVVEIVKGSKNLKEAYKNIKDKVKEKNKVMTQAEIEKQIEDKANTLLEKKLKDMGLTASGAGAPSGASSSFAKLEQDYADGKISYSDYKKARTEHGLS
jgi:hypothetical protein